MQDIWQKIVDSWQVKMMCSGAVSCLTFLLGDVTAAPFLALWLLVVLDTFTRWAAIEAAVSVAEVEAAEV